MAAVRPVRRGSGFGRRSPSGSEKALEKQPTVSPQANRC
jgi:hypothetical protein